MIDGRVVTGGRDLGSGFCLADRIVATAAHVVSGHLPDDLAFVTSSGIQVSVSKVQVDRAIDTALLWVTRSLAFEPPLGHAHQEAGWQVTARPDPAAAQLTGTVTAVDHLMRNAGGHEMTVLQLRVEEGLKEFAGYSGSAVVVRSVVVGILVEQVQERAAAAGARRRATNVLYAVPIGKVVARFGLGVPLRTRQDEMPVYQLMNTAHFDMDPLKSAIFTAISTREERPIAFGLTNVDMKVVMNLTAWLPTYIGDVAQKGQLALRPEVTSLDTLERYVTRYRADLDRMNVVCPVLVDDVDTDLVAELWKRIRASCGGCRQRLILFLVGRPSDGFPELVDVLPSPSVRRQDIADWARHVVASRRWPSSLAEHWTAEIVAQVSAHQGGQSALDTRLTYEILEHYIERVRMDPNALLRHLEELETRC
jgi:hypothetical protein